MGSHTVYWTAGRERGDGRDSDRRKASRRGNRHKFPLPVSRKSKTGADVFTCEIGKVFENVFFAHSRRKVLQHIVHGHAEATDAGLTATLLGIDGYAVLPIHRMKSSLGNRNDQGRTQKPATAPNPSLNTFSDQPAFLQVVFIDADGGF